MPSMTAPLFGPSLMVTSMAFGDLDGSSFWAPTMITSSPLFASVLIAFKSEALRSAFHLISSNAGIRIANAWSPLFLGRNYDAAVDIFLRASAPRIARLTGPGNGIAMPDFDHARGADPVSHTKAALPTARAGITEETEKSTEHDDPDGTSLRLSDRGEIFAELA